MKRLSLFSAITVVIIIYTSSLFIYPTGRALAEPSSITSDKIHSDIMYLDEPFVVEKSEAILPVGFTESACTTANEFVFDLSSIPLIKNGTYGDIVVSYTTSSSLDKNVWVFNFKINSWHQIAFASGPGVAGLAIISGQSHLLSAEGVNARDCIDGNYHLKLRWDNHRWGPPSIQVLKTNPRYSEIKISMPVPANILTYDGKTFWAADKHHNRIFNISPSGEEIKAIIWPQASLYGLAFDEKNLWLAAYPEKIYKLDENGNILSQFTINADEPGALTWADGKLWLAEGGGGWAYAKLPNSKYYGRRPRIFCIDPEASCKTGSAVIVDSFTMSSGRIDDLTWTGEHILVIRSDRLYKVTTKGEILKSYDLPISTHAWGNGVTWDGKTLWITHAGAKGSGNRGNFIGRFKFR